MKSTDTYERYQRQMVLPNFGSDAQQKLALISVLVVGVGGLGCPLLLSLSAVGIGRLGIVDDDCVELSNLPRQTLFGDADVGRAKVQVAEKRLREMNGNTAIQSYHTRCNATNAIELLRGYDLVVDASDSFSTRYCLNDACTLLGKPLVYAAVQEFQLQISLFNALLPDGSRSGTLRCIFPQPPDPRSVRGCDMAGVLGLTTQLAAAVMAGQVVGIATRSIDLLANVLLTIDTRTMTSQKYFFTRQEDLWLGAPGNEREFSLTNYAVFCGETARRGDEIDVAELEKLIHSGDNFCIIDIREAIERTKTDVPSTLHIPHSELETRAAEIPVDGLVILMCSSGKRSLEAVLTLRREHTRSNLRSLYGGYNEWYKNQSVHTKQHA